MSEPLIQIVDAALASAAARSGPHLVCHPGCSPCCHGVFQISPLDAHRLRQGLALAQTDDPDRASRIHTRLTAARAHLTPFFPGDPPTGRLGEDEGQTELFEEAFHTDPCPILDPVTHTCDLYAHRPIVCRTFGPPIRNEHNQPEAGLSLCELCFTTATDSEIAAAEMDSSFRPLEAALETEHLLLHPADGPTFIAYAFPS